MKDKIVLEGGCLCGKLRYQISALPFAADYCHCVHCQKISGAPVMAWMDFKSDQVTWLEGHLREYASSATVRRGFCADCGATLSFRHLAHPAYLTLAIVSLDAPDRVAPTYHIYTDHQRHWCHLQDDLPRFSQGQV